MKRTEMEKSEFLKRSEEILEEIDCWNGLENECIKLLCLFSCCTTLKHKDSEFVNINYVIEKVLNVLINHPIILDSAAKRKYISMRLERENMEKPK